MPRPESGPTPDYTSADFTLPKTDECDLVLKGGITSGIVYPYALLELARRYRFRSIGGTSVGAIAAAFAAAAEYARSERDDPEGFLRLKWHCDALPEILPDLFQPDPQYRTLVNWLRQVQAGSGVLRSLLSLVVNFWGTALSSAAMGALLVGGLGGGLAGAVAGGFLGISVGMLVRLKRLLDVLPETGFGFCGGRTVKGARGEGLTDWMHRALQDIAFGPVGREHPLTFGDLMGGDPDKPRIDLRMVTTNLSMSRPHTLPRMGLATYYRPDVWDRYFPGSVMTHMAKTAGASRLAGFLPFPSMQQLPVLVAARMSLSFPVLFQAVPMAVRDVESWIIQRHTGAADPKIRARTVWFSDGGISSNFPVHLFDALLPTRPTFALSLDELPEDANPEGDRVRFPKSARDNVGAPVRPIRSMSGFAASLLGAAKDWQDQLLTAMPGQRERVARIYLDPTQGGLNLTMPRERSEQLMSYGRRVGQGFADGALDFDSHRWGRALLAYENLEAVTHQSAAAWGPGGFGTFLGRYLAHVARYQLTPRKRAEVARRLEAFVDLSVAMTPRRAGPNARGFPRPAGKLRIVPDP